MNAPVKPRILPYSQAYPQQVTQPVVSPVAQSLPVQAISQPSRFDQLLHQTQNTKDWYNLSKGERNDIERELNSYLKDMQGKDYKKVNYTRKGLAYPESSWIMTNQKDKSLIAVPTSKVDFVNKANTAIYNQQVADYQKQSQQMAVPQVVVAKQAWQNAVAQAVEKQQVKAGYVSQNTPPTPKEPLFLALSKPQPPSSTIRDHMPTYQQAIFDAYGKYLVGMDQFIYRKDLRDRELQLPVNSRYDPTTKLKEAYTKIVTPLRKNTLYEGLYSPYPKTARDAPSYEETDYLFTHGATMASKGAYLPSLLGYDALASIGKHYVDPYVTPDKLGGVYKQGIDNLRENVKAYDPLNSGSGLTWAGNFAKNTVSSYGTELADHPFESTGKQAKYMGMFKAVMPSIPKRFAWTADPLVDVVPEYVQKIPDIPKGYELPAFATTYALNMLPDYIGKGSRYVGGKIVSNPYIATTSDAPVATYPVTEQVAQLTTGDTVASLHGAQSHDTTKPKTYDRAYEETSVPFTYGTHNIGTVIPTGNIFTDIQSNLRKNPMSSPKLELDYYKTLKLSKDEIQTILSSLQQGVTVPTTLSNTIYARAKAEANTLQKPIVTLTPKRLQGFQQSEVEHAVIYPDNYKQPFRMLVGFANNGTPIYTSKPLSYYSQIAHNILHKGKENYADMSAKVKENYLQNPENYAPWEYEKHGKKHLIDDWSKNPWSEKYDYFHDITKNQDISEEFAEIPHAKTSASYFKQFAKNNNLDKKYARKIAQAIRYHEGYRPSIQSLFLKPVKRSLTLPSIDNIKGYVVGKFNPHVGRIATLDRMDLKRFGIAYDPLFVDKKYTMQPTYTSKLPATTSSQQKTLTQHANKKYNTYYKNRNYMRNLYNSYNPYYTNSQQTSTPNSYINSYNSTYEPFIETNTELPLYNKPLQANSIYIKPSQRKDNLYSQITLANSLIGTNSKNSKNDIKEKSLKFRVYAPLIDDGTRSLLLKPESTYESALAKGQHVVQKTTATAFGIVPIPVRTKPDLKKGFPKIYKRGFIKYEQRFHETTPNTGSSNWMRYIKL